MISPVRNVGGEIVNYVAGQRDVTRETQLEAQFRQAQKMEAFGQLAGGVAHDFNNILMVIQMQAGLLEEETNLSPEQREFIESIHKASERAADLTRQLLLFSRKQVMQPREIELNEVLEGITKMLHRTLGERIQLRFHLSRDPLALHADPGMIHQILLNLLVNARDAMPRGGKILIETSMVEFDELSASQNVKARPGRFACVSVSDTGTGIPPETLPRIFEPFFTTKEVGKGTGLGLATIYGIVEQHQGWINAYSELGQGTTFRIYLPLRRAPGREEEPEPSRAALPRGSETLLLVEDEQAVRASISSTLSRLGYQVLEAANGQQALEIWTRHRDRIDLLLTDLVMPGDLTGIELAARLLREKPSLKVMYASGYSAEIAGENLHLESGVNFLPKPFSVSELAHTVRSQLSSTE